MEQFADFLIDSDLKEISLLSLKTKEDGIKVAIGFRPGETARIHRFNKEFVKNEYTAQELTRSRMNYLLQLEQTKRFTGFNSVIARYSKN